MEAIITRDMFRILSIMSSQQWTMERLRGHCGIPTERFNKAFRELNEGGMLDPCWDWEMSARGREWLKYYKEREVKDGAKNKR